MKTRFILRLLTLTSLLPLASCSHSSDEDAPEAEVEAGSNSANNAANANNAGNSNNAANANNAGNANNANNAGFDDDLNGENENGNEKNSNNLANEGDGTDDFSDDSDKDLADADASPAANAGANINGFSNNTAAEDFMADPTANMKNNVAANEGINAFKNTTGEANAFANGSAPVALNDTPINTANAAVPAPVVNQATANIAPPAAALVSTQAPAVHDIDSTPATLHWVGYKINESLKKVDLEIITKGRPEYEVFEQSNRIHQSELIIRFHHTVLRRKLHWDVNSSEFRSPVAYIRMREKKNEGYVDLVITHRDNVEPQFYEKDGSFLLSYTIPDRYLGGQASQAKVVKDKAVSLRVGQSNPLAFEKKPASKLPGVGFPRNDVHYREQPKFAPLHTIIGLMKPIKTGKDGLPESFDKTIVRGKRTGEILSRRTLVGVAQDNLEDDFADEPNEAAVIENVTNTGNSTGNANFNNNSKVSSGNNASMGNELNNASPNAFSNLNDKPEAVPAKPAKSGNAAKAENLNAPMENISAPGNATTPTPSPVPEPMMQTTDTEAAVQDVDAENGATKRQKYTGKPIFMDFYDSPLSLVLRSFQDETGNNFVFPADVGATSVTFQFKGVPWDEALKAILETHSLGMVRVGENVVRVDKIANLSSYMQALETAKQFESRRIPTKVMVFRVNNAVAKDIKTGVAALLARDISVDDRIKITEDDRSNQLVIEAPEAILSKAKAIIERLDLETPQVEITSRIVEVSRTQNNFFGVAWGNSLNFDPGRALGFGGLAFPNSVTSNFSVDPGISTSKAGATGRLSFGSLNKFLDLDLLLRLEEKKGTTNVLQSNRVLVLDGQKASVLAGSSQFFRPAAGGNVINPAPGAAPAAGASGLAEITFNLLLDVTPQVTALGNVIMNLLITSDTPGDQTGEVLASKGTRRLATQMVRASGDTGVIGGIYDTKRTSSVQGVPFLSDLPIIGALFRSTSNTESQTELLIMVTPTIISGPNDAKVDTTAMEPLEQASILSQKKTSKKEGKF